MRYLKLITLLSCISLMTGCVTPSGKSFAQTAGMIPQGATEQVVLNMMGTPDSTEFGGRNKVLKFCGTGYSSDDMIYVLLVDGRVKQVLTEQSRFFGVCSSYYRSVNWQETDRSGYLSLNGTNEPTRSYSTSSPVANALENSMQQNNQMYNSLIENMGRQQQSLQPQRFQTNCMMIGNMMSCN